jgi:ERF superfamily
MGSMSRTLVQELSEVMGLVGYVQKDGNNSAQSYRYASAESVLKKVNAELSARGVAISSSAELLHFTVTQYEQSGESKTGKTYTQVKFRTDAAVRITLTFNRDSETITVQGLGQSTDVGDKAVMKANTAAIKYCLTNAFLISWGDDPEADPAGDPPYGSYYIGPNVKPETKTSGKSGLKKVAF